MGLSFVVREQSMCLLLWDSLQAWPVPLLPGRPASHPPLTWQQAAPSQQKVQIVHIRVKDLDPTMVSSKEDGRVDADPDFGA